MSRSTLGSDERMIYEPISTRNDLECERKQYDVHLYKRSRIHKSDYERHLRNTLEEELAHAHRAIYALERRVAESDTEIRLLKEKCDHLYLKDLRMQGDRSRKKLAEICGLGPTDGVNTRSLDGMLKDLADPDISSLDLVRDVRGH